MNVFKAVRKRLSLSMSGGAGATSGNAQEAHLVSKSMEDLRLAPYEENDGNDMVFYCKLLGSEYVQDKNGSELARFAERVIQSYTGKEGAGLGTGSAINDESGGAAASAANSKRVLGKNKTMIRVNSDGLELSTDGSTEKNRFKLCHVSFVSAAFTYSHCAAIICQSVSSPTKWRAYLLLFSKPKYAKRFAVFMARQFDVGYEKWQSEQAVGTLDLAVEQEALKLKSRLKQGLTNKTFVLDDEDDLVITPKTSTTTPGVQHAKTSSDTGNEAGDKTEHSSEHNCPTTNNSGQISHVTSSSSSVNEVFAEAHNEDQAIADQPRDPRDQSQMSRRIVGTRPQSVTTPTGFPSQSVPQHLLDSREGYNEFANAERELCSLMKGSHVQKDHSSSPILDDPFASRTAASWAPHQDPFMSFFEMRNSNMDPSDTSFSSTSLFSTQMSNGGVSGFTPFENIEEHKVGEQEENQNQNFLLEL